MAVGLTLLGCGDDHRNASSSNGEPHPGTGAPSAGTDGEGGSVVGATGEAVGGGPAGTGADTDMPGVDADLDAGRIHTGAAADDIGADAGVVVGTGGDAGAAADTGTGVDAGAVADTGTGIDAGMQDVSLDSEIPEVAALAMEWKANAEALCTCYEVFLYDDFEQCVDSQLTIQPDEIECTEEVLADRDPVSLAYLDCAVSVAQNLTECLSASSECGEAARQRLDQCSSVYTTGLALCTFGLFPSETFDELGSCGLFD